MTFSTTLISFFTGVASYLGVSIGLILNTGSEGACWTTVGLGAGAFGFGPNIALAADFALSVSGLGVSNDFAGALDTTGTGAGLGVETSFGSSLTTAFGAYTTTGFALTSTGAATGADLIGSYFGNSTFATSLTSTLTGSGFVYVSWP